MEQENIYQQEYRKEKANDIHYSKVWNIFFCRAADAQILYGDSEQILSYFGLSYGINSHDYDRLDKSHIIHQLVHTPYKGMRIEVICPIEEDCIDCNNCRINPAIEEAIQKILDVQEEGITSSLQFSF